MVPLELLAFPIEFWTTRACRTAIIRRTRGVARHRSTRTEALARRASARSTEATSHARDARASEPASRTETHAAAAHVRDPLPGLRLLVGGEDGDGVATIGEGLLAHAIHLRPHLVHPLAHLRSGGRVGPSGAGETRPH